MEEECKESYYKETSNVIKSRSISLRDLQGEEFTTHNEIEDVKGDRVLPIIQKDMMYKKYIF